MKLLRALALVLAAACLSLGQTVVSDTLYYTPNPSLSGTLAFNGTVRATPPVGRGSVVTSATDSAGGLSVSLAPTSYTVDYLLNGSSVCTERWNVPTAGTALTIYQVRGSTSKCAVREASEPGFLAPSGNTGRVLTVKGTLVAGHCLNNDGTNATDSGNACGSGSGTPGATGPTGPAGSAATVAVGTTTTGAPGSSAAVTNSGNSSAAVFNFSIPAAATGPTGPQGSPGSTPANPSLGIGTVSTLSPGASATAGVSGSYPSFNLNLGIPQGSAGSNGSNGSAGAPGAAASVSIGSTATGAAGSSASVSNSGTSSAAVLNFTIPAGSNGAVGATGPSGPTVAATNTSLGAVYLPSSSSTTTILPVGLLGTAANGITDDSSALASTCSSSSAEIYLLPSASYAINSSITLNCKIHHFSASKFIVATGVTLIINQKPDAPLSQIYQENGTGKVSFGAGVVGAPGEWFGAVGDSSPAGVGTDNTTSLQNTANALTNGPVQLQAGIYKTSATLVFNRSNIGISGTTYGAPSSSSIDSARYSKILCTSASADIIDVGGTSPTTKTLWNRFNDFALQRSVAPTGTAAGLSSSFTGGEVVERVWSHDSIRLFYQTNVSSFGTGVFKDIGGGWGAQYAPTYTSNISVVAMYMDSSNGYGMDSFRLDRAGFANKLGLAITPTGVLDTGAAINDQFFLNLETANMSIGFDIEYLPGTTTEPLPASDIHCQMCVFDGNLVSGIKVNNVSAGAFGGVSFDDVWLINIDPTNPGTYMADIESSSGVLFSRMQVMAANSTAGVYANNSADLVFNQNIFSNTSGTMLWLNNTTDSSGTGNKFRGSSGTPTATMLKFTGSQTNTFSGNTFSGYGTTAISLDSTSTFNSLCGNTINTSHITTTYSDPSNAANCVMPGQTVIRGGHTVTYSATPTFDPTYLVNLVTMTGNITGFTIGAGQSGQSTSIVFCQDATGSRTVSGVPSNVRGFFPSGIGATANTCSSQTFFYSAGKAAWIASGAPVLNE